MARGISDDLRSAIENSGQTMYEIAKGAGLSYPVVYRFTTGERDLKLSSAAKIAAYLGLELRPKAKPEKRKTRGRRS